MIDEPELTLVQQHILEIFAETAYLARTAMGHARRNSGWGEYDRIFRPYTREEKRARLNEWRRSHIGRQLTRRWMAGYRARPHVKEATRAYSQQPEVKARARANELRRLKDPAQLARKRERNRLWMRAHGRKKEGK